MAKAKTTHEMKTPCVRCPLRELKHFREFNSEELEFVSRFKRGELAVDAGATIFVEGAHSAHLFTVLHGWGFRYKTLEDGRRQILNYVMPGDLIGLQGTIMGEMQHSIEALSPVSLCVFERDKLPGLYNKHPSLAFDLTWIAAREERILDEHLLSIGRSIGARKSRLSDRLPSPESGDPRALREAGPGADYPAAYCRHARTFHSPYQ